MSRQFRALLRFTGLWALPWIALGAAVAIGRWVASPELSTTAGSLGGWLLTHALAYGALGTISGLYFGLLLVQFERGRRLDRVGARRLGLWSGLGGAAPPVLFAALGLIFGAPAVVYLPLLGLGVISAVGSTLLATSTRAAAMRAALAQEQGAPRLPAA